MDVEILPGAALNEPRLQQAIAQRVGRRIGRSNALRMQNILGHYPWREYGYKYGRWQKVGTFFNQITDGYKWGHVFQEFALVDLATGARSGRDDII